MGIANHSYVKISDIGPKKNPTLLCHTNYYSGGGTSGGDWYAPDGTRVGHKDSNTVPGFERNRGIRVVRMFRIHSTPVMGMYRCVILDVTNTNQAAYVGLYMYNSVQGLSNHDSYS